MTDQEKENRSKALEEMLASDGGHILMAHLDEESRDGWEKFIDLPVAKKISKAGYDASARYRVLQDLKEWIASEIKIGKI